MTTQSNTQSFPYFQTLVSMLLGVVVVSMGVALYALPPSPGKLILALLAVYMTFDMGSALFNRGRCQRFNAVIRPQTGRLLVGLVGSLLSLIVGLLIMLVVLSHISG